MMNVIIGCSVCGKKLKYKVKLPLDCNTLLCPGCQSDNSLSIISVYNEPSMFDFELIRKRLQRVREIDVL